MNRVVYRYVLATQAICCAFRESCSALAKLLLRPAPASAAASVLIHHSTQTCLFAMLSFQLAQTRLLANSQTQGGRLHLTILICYAKVSEAATQLQLVAAA